MDKHEFGIRTEQLRRLVGKKDYEAAAEIADKIDWTRVRDVPLLTQVSEVYEKLERYEDCYEILNIAYDYAPIGRMIVFKMVELAATMKDFGEAISLYKEFVKIAPHDLSRYVLKYKIYKERGSSIEDQIAILEEYKSREYQEKWSYELAELYYEAGLSTKCVEECNDLILWFSEGEYVRKAMELKAKIEPLSASQEEKYAQLIQATKEEEIHKNMKVPEVNLSEFNTINLQAELANSISDIYDDIKPNVEVIKEVEVEKKLEKQLEIKKTEYTTQGLSINQILEQWEEKKQQTEEALQDAAKREEEKKKEREILRETGRIPQILSGEESLIPVEIQKILAEIEGKLPVKIHVEHISKKEEKISEPIIELPVEEPVVFEFIPEDIRDILECRDEEINEPEILEKVEEFVEIEEESMDIRDILEYKEIEPSLEEADLEELPEESIDIRDILNAPTEEIEESIEKEEVEADIPVEIEVKEEEPTLADELEKTLETEVASMHMGSLNEEERNLFAYFTSVRGMQKQLDEVLEQDRKRHKDGTSRTGNVIITGESGSGKTTLAMDVAKELQRQRGSKKGKLAKITAESLNRQDAKALIGKRRGGALIIEQAGDLSTETAIKVSAAMLEDTENLLVILEGEQTEIQRLFARCESLGAKFTMSVDIPVFTNKELVAFGESYLEEQGFVLDEMAMLELYTQIGIRQTNDHLVNVTEVKDILDAAMEKAEKKNAFGRRKKGRLNEYGSIVIWQKDFEE